METQKDGPMVENILLRNLKTQIFIEKQIGEIRFLIQDEETKKIRNYY